MQRFYSQTIRSALRHRVVLAKLSPFRSLSTSVPSDSFLSGNSTAYVEEMYRNWLHNPNSVHKSWDVYFRTGSYQAPPSLVAEYTSSGRADALHSVIVQQTVGAPNLDVIKVMQLVRAFQVRGHFLSDLDPLGLSSPSRVHPQELELGFYGFSEADLDREIDFSSVQGLEALEGFVGKNRGKITLRQLYTRLKQTYCGRIGFEYMHIPYVDQCNWIRNKIETREQMVYNREEKLQILNRLGWADHFERFLATKYNLAKRFGLEGGESVIPGLKALIDRSAELGVDSVVMGMPHRGRLNVLASVIKKPMEAILCEFQGRHDDENWLGSGDVKYHLGLSHDRPVGKDGKSIHLSLLANPSHLEAVDPVVCGKTRAKQFYKNDTEHSKVMGILLHGDAAFAGQGVVYETMGLMDLAEYSTGGTIHVVVNNQIGFTTDPVKARSTPYCTDVAKAFNAPIFHVNGDDPEAVVQAHELAAEWRSKFKRDVVLDVVCYRKHGHNEVDEPSFTQPLMYQKVAKKTSTFDLYAKQLIAEKAITEDDVKILSNKINETLEKSFEASKTYKKNQADWLSSRWTGFYSPRVYSQPQNTGVEKAKLKEVGSKLTALPKGFTIHNRLKAIMEKKKQAIETEKDIDWGTAEALAFGSLLAEGTHVRLSGQDVERGTFSHRHSVVHDQKTGDKYTSLNHLANNQAHLTVSNSHLSEFGVLGFELGYSLENPNALVLWEAQFGDFANGAQVMIDQFISSGEDKWLRQSGLVMLLPHGYEGQGSEHSSARLERFLQLCSDHPDQLPDPQQPKAIQSINMQVCNITTPANYFHVLRRQIYRLFRKPLVIMSPKSLLRAPQARSDLSEMASGTRFMPVIPEHESLTNVRRHIFCSGKVYYDLLARRIEKGIKDVAITRVEQIAPFPYYQVAEEAKRFPNAEIVWCQEEPMNMGAWFYTAPRLETALRETKRNRPRYVGRAPSASPATGLYSIHNRETDAFLTDAFSH